MGKKEVTGDIMHQFTVETTRFRSALQAAEATLRRFGEAISQAAKPALLRMGKAMYFVAEKTYRIKVGKPPGSMRTSRLRKKRRTAVLRWFCEDLKRGTA